MTILVTGNRGYIGSILVPMLMKRGHTVIGLDCGYYDDVNLPPVPEPHRQVYKDVRDIIVSDVANIDAVIHLAALSNDPLGELEPRLTEEINRDSTIRLATFAKKAGVKRFVYSSSQSMYGVADPQHEVEEATGDAKHAITTYARTKWEAEVGIKKLNDENFTVVCLRLSTVFGASPRLRSDIVFNSLVGSAYTTGEIEIKSDGTPWRPVIHVEDASLSFVAVLEAPMTCVSGESFNVGMRDGNFTVRELAEIAQRATHGSVLSFTNEHTDNRTYRVSFKKFFSALKEYYRPKWNVAMGAQELIEFFKRIGFNEHMFRAGDTNRLSHIRDLVHANKLDKNLRFQSASTAVLLPKKQETILITGLTGFVGSHMADFILEKTNARIVGFRRWNLSRTHNIKHLLDNPRVTFYDCDITDAVATREVIAEIKPDKVFHFAAESFVSPSWRHPTHYMDVNYTGTVNLLEAIRASGINPRFHIPGSGEEYGDIPESEIPITATTPLRPVNPYAVSKIAQDYIGYVYFRSYGLNIIRTRAFNHEGPRRDKVFGIPSYAYQIARIESGKQEPVIRVGGMDDKRNFTHIKDMVEAYWCAMEKATPGELYLIGADENEHVYTFREALSALIEISNIPNKRAVSIEQDQQLVRPTSVPLLIGDTKAFRRLTNWKPKIGFEQILRDTLEYWREFVKLE